MLDTFPACAPAHVLDRCAATLVGTTRKATMLGTFPAQTSGSENHRPITLGTSRRAAMFGTFPTYATFQVLGSLVTTLVGTGRSATVLATFFAQASVLVLYGRMAILVGAESGTFSLRHCEL